MARSKWKGPYFQNKQKNILYKNSEIVPNFVGKTFQIYNGKSYMEIRSFPF